MRRAGTYGEVPARLARTIQYLVSELPRTLLLERLSQQLGRRAVAAVLEEATSIAGRHRVERSAHCLHERLAGARTGLPEQRLELGERLLDGVEVRRVGRQVQ